MNNLYKDQSLEMRQLEGGELQKTMPKMEMLAMGVATGVAATVIVQTGRGILLALSRNPLFMFGVGVATGYFAHKHRKEIISVGRYSAEQSRNYFTHQKEHLKSILEDRQDKPEN